MADQAQSSSPHGSADGANTLRVSLHREVGFSVREYGGKTSYVAHHPAIGKYFRVGVEEYRVACLFDGTRTVTDIQAQICQEGLDWSAEDIAKFAGELIKQKLATAKSDDGGSEPASPEPSNGQPESGLNDGPGLAQRLPRLLSMMISQRIPLVNASLVAAAASRWIGFAFSRPGFVLWLVLVASGMGVVYGHFSVFKGELQRLFDPGIWPILMGIWCIAKLVHEAGHAVCAHRYGVRLGKMGVMFFLFAPLAYVDVTDAWKLQRRMQRVNIALSGVYLELAIAAIAAWLWWFLPDGLMKHLAAQVFVVTGPATLLVNANPLLRLDGYYVLSDLLEIPNLRMHGRRQLSRRIERVMFGITMPAAQLSGWRKPFATLHAAASVVFQFFWMSGLIVAASMWARGLGIVLAVAALLLWCLLPLTRWIIKVWTLEPGGRFGLNLCRRRILGYVTVLFMIVQHLSTAASPFNLRIPVVVRFQNEQISRAAADAFVVAVYAKRGDRVQQGMMLMELADPELQLRRDQLVDEIQLAEKNSILLRNRGDIAQSEAELENSASLNRQLAELDEQLEELVVVAVRDGIVTSSDPEKLLGAFVHSGDELVRVSDPNDKELLAVIDERDTEAYQIASKSQVVSSIRLRGGTNIRATPAAFRPRARRDLPHPALAATVGGPVPVEPSTDGDERMEMVHPRLESVTPLDPVTSAQTKAGQVGMMTISDNMPLLIRLYDEFVSKYAAAQP